MKNFTFQNPTKIIFGQGSIAQLAKHIPTDAIIMMTYGGGSIKKNGVYDQVKSALKNHTLYEFGGIEANPDFKTLLRCVVECKSRGVDYLLAVGGGSVIDGTKFIASALLYPGDPWEFVVNRSISLKKAVPFAAVLTIPATGSEMNNGAVISRRETKEKYAFYNEEGYPQFSILDPTVIYSLPDRQLANGIIDTFAHTLEQYLTIDDKTMLMDRWSEGILQTLIEVAPALQKNREDYDASANFMLSATMGLNKFIAMGVTEDWATHMIGHELTALHGLDHAVTLAIIYPGIMDVMRQEKKTKLLQYATRIWNITQGDENQRIDSAIRKTEEFFRSLGVKIRLSEHQIGEQTIQEIATRFRNRGWNLGENEIVTPEKVELILKRVL